ncbi:MAG: serine/threonine protein kinase [Oscillospiraceae bacterium]|nr:serine/threonine protein kinase [Oscillospiraceae bacterium]
MLEIGSLVDGKYRILSVVGRGGMSVVYLAINERANKTWAIKEVRKDGISDFEVVKQGLVVETEMLKSFDHPHLPSIVDVLDSEDSFLIVMDFIEGQSLQKVLEKNEGRPVEKERVLEWAKQLCDVLGYLHSRERPIIYRDMKPANVMLQPDESIMLIDFGTAREFKSRSVADTTCLGTRGYAAPEQYGGMGQTDARTDIYCLGATLYHLLTGQSPAEYPYVMYPLGKVIPEYAGSGLEKVVQKCTQPNPDDRYQSCAELLYALDHVDEEDDRARAAQNKKWRRFVAACAVCAVGVAGMIGCRLGWNEQIRQSYDAFVANAQNAPDVNTAVEYYTDAIAMDPARADAYNELIAMMDRDYKLAGDEVQHLTAAFMHTEGGSRTSIDTLREQNPEAHDTLAYRLASDYYFFYTGTDRRSKAASWYAKVLESAHLTQQQRQIATSLHKIGNYYDSLGAGGGKYDFAAQGSTYLDYWKDLVEVTDGDLMERTGHAYIALGLYKDLVYEIYNCTPKFKQAGVEQSEMTAQLDKVRQGLQAIPPADDEDRQQVAAIEKMLTQAESMVNSTFMTVDATAGQTQTSPQDEPSDQQQQETEG